MANDRTEILGPLSASEMKTADIESLKKARNAKYPEGIKTILDMMEGKGVESMRDPRFLAHLSEYHDLTKQIQELEKPAPIEPPKTAPVDLTTTPSDVSDEKTMHRTKTPVDERTTLEAKKMQAEGAYNRALNNYNAAKKEWASLPPGSEKEAAWSRMSDAYKNSSAAMDNLEKSKADISKYEKLNPEDWYTKGEKVVDKALDVAGLSPAGKIATKKVAKKVAGVVPFATLVPDYSEALESGLSKPQAGAVAAFEQVNPLPVGLMQASKLGKYLSKFHSNISPEDLEITPEEEAQAKKMIEQNRFKRLNKTLSK